MTKQIRIAFLGINDAGKRIYDWLVSRGEEVMLLITTKEELQLIEQKKPDIIVSCGFRYKVPASILQVPPLGCVNIHSSYLPFNRGANPNVWSIIENTPAGATIHFMDDKFDTGPIIARRKVGVSLSDNAKDLYKKLEDAQVELFEETWTQIKQQKIKPIKQKKEAGTTHTHKDFKEMCQIELNKRYTGRELVNRLRALTFPPYDNAYLIEKGKKFYLRLEIYPAKDKK